MNVPETPKGYYRVMDGVVRKGDMVWRFGDDEPERALGLIYHKVCSGYVDSDDVHEWAAFRSISAPQTRKRFLRVECN